MTVSRNANVDVCDTGEAGGVGCPPCVPPRTSGARECNAAQSRAADLPPGIHRLPNSGRQVIHLSLWEVARSASISDIAHSFVVTCDHDTSPCRQCRSYTLPPKPLQISKGPWAADARSAPAALLNASVNKRLRCWPPASGSADPLPTSPPETSPGHHTQSTAKAPQTAGVASQSVSGPSSGQSNGTKLARAPSKLSLFSLFNRPKVEKARGHTEVGLAVPMRPQTPPKPSASSKSALRQNPSPAAQQSVRSRSSLMFRPMSMKPPPPENETGSWEPPPLFQAFPQSVKHATLQACVFPPEVLMRTQSQRRQAEILRERIDTARDLSVIEENSTETKKLEKSHKRLISNSVLNPPAPELVSKIYVLVTAGYVIQYAGDGPFDRAPEKVLKLGKDSAAFACDLIPGKHWVLQISSHAHDDGTVEMGPKSTLLSRLRTQNAIGRKAATSFLLILESAEEMDAWMTAVRKEIENNGGQRVKDESVRASSSTDRSSGKQSSETSHRYLVQRDSSIIAAKNAPAVDSPHQSYHAIPLRIATSDWEDTERTPSVASSRKQSSRRSIARQSAEVSSISSTPISQSEVQLDQLRGRSRFSYMSTATSASDTGTRNTSRDPSPTPQSPLRESSAETEPFKVYRSLHSNPSNDTGSRRRSVQPLPITTEDHSMSVEVPAMQRHSYYGPKSPTFDEPANTEPTIAPPVTTEVSAPPPAPFVAAKGLTAHIASQARSVDDLPTCPAINQREDSPDHLPSASRAGTVTAPVSL
ncbi:hypothetical protein OPT61_g10293 [Boeremia exigua]|uniref:Uncharacterized protein n=1 Tax=Boeremia exigua TaxID=749465 RepID=A0ACC2HQE1_9PLEO|nr:hypothetical protein OPT61_g10293 [Boeremia exigua]